MSAIDVSNIPDPEFTELRDAIDAEVYKLGVYQSPILLQSMPGLAVVYSLISSIKQQLTAEREAREKAESNASDLMLAITAAQAFSETELGIIGQVSSPAWRQQLRQIKQRAESAEARVKELESAIIEPVDIEVFRKIGEYLSNALDEDRFNTVEPMLNSVLLAYQKLEQRIKASQEQEPIYEVVICGAWSEVKNKFDYDVRTENERRIRYRQPIIPPEVAELQRENDALRKANIDCVAWFEEARSENAELTRKLAGNEVLLLGAISELGAMKGKSEDEILAECRKNYPSASSKLLSEARKVPEGWNIIQCNEFEIRVESPDKSAWRFRNSDNGTSDQFIYSLLSAMISASPEYKERT